MTSQMVCFDTSALICAIQSRIVSFRRSNIEKEKDPDKREIILSVFNYFDQLMRDQRPILVPPPSVGEFMVPMSLDEMTKFVNLLNKPNIRMPSVSTLNYIVAAQIEAVCHAVHNGSDSLKRIKSNSIEGQRLRTDSVILACAIMHGASAVITLDPKDFRRFQSAIVDVCDNSNFDKDTLEIARSLVDRVKKIRIISFDEMDIVPSQTNLLDRLEYSGDDVDDEDDEDDED